MYEHIPVYRFGGGSYGEGHVRRKPGHLAPQLVNVLGLRPQQIQSIVHDEWGLINRLILLDADVVYYVLHRSDI